MALALPGNEFSLAFGEIRERMEGERSPGFHRVLATEGGGRVAYDKTVYVDTKTGRFAKRSTWKRSKTGRYVRRRVHVPEAAGTTPGILPDAPDGDGPYDTLEEAAQQFEGVTIDDKPLTGKALTDALRDLGVHPFRAKIQGAYSKEEGGPLYIWQEEGDGFAGLDTGAFASFLYQLTRDFMDRQSSPPVVLMNRCEVQPL